MFWNCRGFPWHKGAGLNEVLEDADIVFLAETWERNLQRIPPIPGYIVHSIWNQQTGLRGQGGVACIYKEGIQDLVHKTKDDPHKRYIWIMLKSNSTPLYIAGCYIPHKDSPFYQRHEVDASQPLSDICLDI
eukprot:c13590_g1_i1 orf=3-395(-)